MISVLIRVAIRDISAVSNYFFVFIFIFVVIRGGGNYAAVYGGVVFVVKKHKFIYPAPIKLSVEINQCYFLNWCSPYPQILVRELVRG